jgi:16S rRNA G966 N2-methylase RsmD
MINILKKVFPEPSNGLFNGLKIDNEGLYSITHPKDADIISENIIEIMGTNMISIVDMTAGCGGNLISFAQKFMHTTGIEINKERFELLQNNMKKYNLLNYTLIEGDSLNEIIYNTYNVYFIDPPWGGPEYKKNQNIEIILSGKTLFEIINLLPKGKLIVLKLPFNYNIDKFKDYIIKQIILNNIIILFIIYN